MKITQTNPPTHILLHASAQTENVYALIAPQEKKRLDIYTARPILSESLSLKVIMQSCT